MKSGLIHAVLFLVFGVLLVAVPVRGDSLQNPAQADSVLREIRQRYEEGSYLAAEVEGRRLLEQGDVSDSIRIQAEKYVAFSLVAQDKPQFAASHFWNILQRDSSFDLDPQMTSPKILSNFQKVRERFFADRQASVARQLSIPAARSVTFRTIVFPGWEQLHQGRSRSGYVFLSLGSLSLLSTVVCDIERRSARDAYLNAVAPGIIADRYSAYNRYYKAEVYSAVAYALSYILSEVDVFSSGLEDEKSYAPASPQNNLLSLKIRF